MTRKTKKIGKVVSLAAAEERRYSEQTGRSQQVLNQQRDRLGELSDYRRSYASKAPVDASISSVHWKDYQTFMQRLDQAAQSQRQVIRECEQNLEMHRQRWLIKRQKLESLERVLEKCEKRDAIYAARLEQKQLDELQNNQQNVFKDGDG
tara:strand:- start:36573 stop:37022 length:450 start_codon:yes stop_codon:yes gene_type:complete